MSAHHASRSLALAAACSLPFLFAVACSGDSSDDAPAGGTGPSAGGDAGSAGAGGGAGAAGAAGSAGAAGAAGTAGAAGAGGASARLTWDLTGVIGSGQSLSVGAQAQNVASTTQPYANLKLSLGSLVVPPFDPASPQLSLVPLVEPIRPFANTYPSAYPANIYGETPHTAMGSQISALVRASANADYVTVHSVVGENGQGMVMLNKAAVETVNGATSTGRAYAATLFEVQAIKRLADAQSKTYGVGAIILTHGETDSGNANYEADLVQLWTDYNADIKAITGQTESIPLLVNQQHGVPYAAGTVNGASGSTLIQWKVGVNHPRDILCVGPKYQYPYAADNLHLNTLGYQLVGEKFGQVYFERVVLGRDWAPLQPTGVSVEGRVVSVTFSVPVPPLAWDDALPAPHQTALTEWQNGRGFELRSGNTPIPITSVEIAGDRVNITAGADLPAGAIVGYAITSDGTVPPNASPRMGQLRDSDPFVGAVTNQAQPNYAVAFELPLP
jgi:hypothetical protein